MNTYLAVLKKYSVFTGRATRSEFWMFYLVTLIIEVIIYGLALALESVSTTLTALLFGLYFIYALGVILPSIGVSIRRLHDTNRSGWWMFISLIPLVGGIILIVFFATDGTPGDNTYGPNPKVVPSIPTPAV